MKYFQQFTNSFPAIILVCCSLSLYSPAWFTWFSGDLITIGLAIIMLGMGLTLTLADFKGILKSPKWVLCGLILQFTIMPLLGYSCAKLYNLPDYFAAGLILVACCPGGTASNVITYLAKGNVALSVTMTAFSTLAAIFLTPLLTTVLVGNTVEVDGYKLFFDTVKVVLLPVLAGILLNGFFPAASKYLVPVAPPVAVIFITLIVASIIGAGKQIILNSAFALFVAVITLHFLGFFLGYIVSKVIIKNESASRTIGIEVGMQNSGLGAVLARSNFTNPAAAIPSALSSLTHCIFGSMFAYFCRKKPVIAEQEFIETNEVLVEA